MFTNPQCLDIQILCQENNRDVPGTAMEVEDTHMQINSKDSDASATVPTLNPAKVLLLDLVVSTIPFCAFLWVERRE